MEFLPRASTFRDCQKKYDTKGKSMKKKWIVCVILLSTVSIVRAEPVTYNFTGDITLISNRSGTANTNTTYSVGQTITASVTYDLATGGEGLDFTGSSTYTNVLKSFWVDNGIETIGRTALDVDSEAIFRVDNQRVYDGVSFKMSASGAALFTGSSFNGFPLSSILLSFDTSDTSLYSDTSIPSSIDPSDFRMPMLLITYGDSGGDGGYVVFAQQQAVPEPATAMMLFFGGGIGFVVHRLRRWANR
jgi:hypothetical protein